MEYLSIQKLFKMRITCSKNNSYCNKNIIYGTRKTGWSWIIHSDSKTKEKRKKLKEIKKSINLDKFETDMIITQRAYPMNGKALSTTDEIMTMVNGIKR